MKVDRTSAPVAINFDGTPDEVFADLRRAAGECPWCGAVSDDNEKCSARCEASRRRADRMDS